MGRASSPSSRGERKTINDARRPANALIVHLAVRRWRRASAMSALLLAGDPLGRGLPHGRDNHSDEVTTVQQSSGLAGERRSAFISSGAVVKPMTAAGFAAFNLRS